MYLFIYLFNKVHNRSCAHLTIKDEDVVSEELWFIALKIIIQNYIDLSQLLFVAVAVVTNQFVFSKLVQTLHAYWHWYRNVHKNSN